MEQLPGDPVGGGPVELAVEEVDLPGTDVFDGGKAEFDQTGLGAAGRRVHEPLFRRDVHAPDHESPGKWA
jgi:hypothetical protein